MCVIQEKCFEFDWGGRCARLCIHTSFSSFLFSFVLVTSLPSCFFLSPIRIPSPPVPSSALFPSTKTKLSIHLQLSFTVGFVAGHITLTLDRLIALYRPDALVASLSLKGRVGSVSKYHLSHSPVPVIVVRRAMAKRRQVPKQGRHFEEELGQAKTQNITTVALTPTTTNT